MSYPHCEMQVRVERIETILEKLSQTTMKNM